ncbi:MAG: DUF58 domain-containing protein [Planctomycetes bacterium]|nr:DUF58 domain-containing protein [Planctomycetota bacterium]
MKRRAVMLPPPPTALSAPFRELLHALLARGVRLRGERTETARARRTALSQSGTFVGHRPYTRGDDLRRLDWAAYARSGEFFLKQLEQEERRSVTLWLDLSPRLAAGSPPRRLAAVRLAAVLGGLALRRLDGLTVLAPGHSPSVATFTGAADLDELLHWLDSLPYTISAPERGPELALQRSLPGRVHWLSDFARPKACERPLLALRRRGVKVTGWLPALAEDRGPVARGALRLVDPETGDELMVAVDDALAAELERQLATLARQQDRLFAQAGCRLVRWPVPAADDLRLEAWSAILTEVAR